MCSLEFLTMHMNPFALLGSGESLPKNPSSQAQIQAAVKRQKHSCAHGNLLGNLDFQILSPSKKAITPSTKGKRESSLHKLALCRLKSLTSYIIQYENHTRNNLQPDDVIEAQNPVHMWWSTLMMKNNVNRPRSEEWGPHQRGNSNHKNSWGGLKTTLKGSFYSRTSFWNGHLDWNVLVF